MTRRLLIVYVAVVFGPLIVAAIAFALRDWLARRASKHHGDGHAKEERLMDTVEEVRAP